MQPLYPLTFDLMGLTRNLIWGGSKLKSLVPAYPKDVPLAEIWLVSDRPEDGRIGMVTNGALAGVSLTELMKQFPTELLGKVKSVNGKFPLLIKLLDPTEAFSLQVHPDATVAKQLGGESKTEFWTFLPGTDAGSLATVGLKKGVNRAQFESTLRAGGDLTPMLHQMLVKPGDSLYVYAGRLHSMNGGALIYEVQENSNTTYRVFDWNRVDAKTGKPRALHIDEALASIDFADIEPGLDTPTIRTEQAATVATLVDTPLFTVERWTATGPITHQPATHQSFEIVTAIDGSTNVSGGGQSVELGRFGTTLVPAAVEEYEIRPSEHCVYLRTFVRT